MNDIIGGVNDRIDSEIDRRLDEISSSTEITANELRELRGTLYAREGGEERIKVWVSKWNIGKRSWIKQKPKEKITKPYFTMQ